MKLILRPSILALCLMAASGCSSSSSLLPPSALTGNDASEAMEIAARACGCKASASGTFQEDFTGDLIRFRISGKGTGDDPNTSFADFGTGTATFTNLTTGFKYTLTFDHIQCSPDQVALFTNNFNTNVFLQNNVVTGLDVDRVSTAGAPQDYTFTIQNENLVKITPLSNACL